MALTLGTNCGFVTTAPTADPASTNTGDISQYVFCIRHTSPVYASKITEVGWWCDNATAEANFEVGLYDNDGASGEAGTLLQVSRTNAKGTDAGWKVVSGLNWTLLPNKIYWIAFQQDTSTGTLSNYVTTGGFGADFLAGQTTLPSPLGADGFTDTHMAAIYAKVQKVGGGASIDWIQYNRRRD